jgi:hypothetical protein
MIRLCLLALSLSLAVPAASVHAHGAGGCTCHLHPDAMPSPHGGVILETSREHHIELVNEGDQLSIFLMDHALKSLDLSKVEVEAEILIPGRRRTKKEPLKLQKSGDHYIADIDLGGNVYRYKVNFKLKEKDWNETVQFQVESW